MCELWGGNFGISKGKIHFFPNVLKKWSSCQKNGYHFLGGGQGQGATSIDKIGEVRLSGEIGGGGVEISKKLNFIITKRYEIPTFLLVGPFLEEGGRPDAEIFDIFSSEVAP